MKPLVVDASVVAAVLLEDERNDKTSLVEQEMALRELTAPAHFPFELGSVLTKAFRRQRISMAELSEALSRGDRLARVIRIAPASSVQHLGNQALLHELTVYDAAYLDLALVIGADLATNDTQLIKAARARGVGVLTMLA